MIKDQRVFMEAGEHSTNRYNEQQFNLYLNLIREEMTELEDAVEHQNKVKILDGLMDVLVVTLGAAHSLGIDVYLAWDEVVKSNMSKVDPTTGKLVKREDGKILKPEGYKKPNFNKFFGE